jgi:hypothetical protein
MIRRVGSSVVAVALFLVAVGPARANFITNGDFEAGSFAGWQTSFLGASHVQTGTSGSYGPHSGNNFALLAQSPSTPVVLSQTFSDPTPGEALTIKFWLASDGSTPNGFTATFNGVTLFSATNIPATGSTIPLPYTLHTFSVTSTSSNTLTFSAFDGPSFLALDDVEANPAGVTAVPEPASLTLLGIGAISLLGYRRVRRFAKA